MSGVPGKVSTGAGISLGADGYSTSSGTFSAGTTPPITGALNIDASGYGGTFLAATNTSGSSITMSIDATTNTMTVNGNVVVTGTVSEAAVSEGPLTITGGTVTVSTPFLQATQSWNAAGVTFTGMKVNVTDTASASGSLLQDLQVGGVSKFSITKAGAVTAASNLSVATGAAYQINGTSVLNATTLGSGVTGSSLTSVGTLTAGAVPASLVTAGTFGAGAYTFPGALAITGAFTGATTGAFSSTLAVTGATTLTGNVGIGTAPTAGAQIITIGGATTGPQYAVWSNTGASLCIGIEKSTGGNNFVGSSAYASTIGTYTATSLQFGTNSTVNLTIASGGAATFSSTVTSTGTLTTGSGSGESLTAGSISLGKDIGIVSGQGIVQGAARILTFTSGAATFSGAISTAERLAIAYPSAGVVLQGYVANTLRIAVNGSDSNSGSRGSLLALNGEFSGTLAVTGAATFSSTASSDSGFKLSAGNVSVPTATATTLVAITGLGAYMVSYTLYANGGASYRGYAIVLHDSVNPVIISQANGSVNISVSVSGSNIQVTQISGGTMTIYWNATRFSMT